MLDWIEILGTGSWVDILSFLSHLVGHSRDVFALAGLIVLVARALPSVSIVAMRDVVVLQLSLGWWCVPSGIFMNAGTQGSPGEHDIV